MHTTFWLTVAHKHTCVTINGIESLAMTALKLNGSSLHHTCSSRLSDHSSVWKTKNRWKIIRTALIRTEQFLQVFILSLGFMFFAFSLSYCIYALLLVLVY